MVTQVWSYMAEITIAMMSLLEGPGFSLHSTLLTKLRRQVSVTGTIIYANGGQTLTHWKTNPFGQVSVFQVIQGVKDNTGLRKQDHLLLSKPPCQGFTPG